MTENDPREEIIKRSKDNSRQRSARMVTDAAELPETHEATRMFLDRMSPAWETYANRTDGAAVASLHGPMLAELESATRAALQNIEDRLVALEKSIQTP